MSLLLMKAKYMPLIRNGILLLGTGASGFAVASRKQPNLVAYYDKQEIITDLF